MKYTIDTGNNEYKYDTSDEIPISITLLEGDLSTITIRWEEITGDQDTINISGFTNDSGYISDISTFSTDDLTEGTTNLYDKTITFVNGNNINITGTYPNFTIVDTSASSSDLSTHTGDSTIHFTQGNISIPASQISDFDTEVSNNTDVSANTSARHSAVTVTDSSEIDFTLIGQDITAVLKTGSIDILKLDTGVQTSLGLADSSIQPLDNISTLTNDSGFTTNIGTVTDVSSANTDISVATGTSTPVLTLNSATSGANKILKIGGDGKIDSSVLPSIAIIDTFVVANETEQLALTIQKGDVAVRTDIDTSYINQTGNNSAMSDWVELISPKDGVTSISAGNGLDFSTITSSGSVVLGTPSEVSTTSTNGVTPTSHTHALSSAVKTSLGLADSSIQPLDNISELTNDSGFTTNTGTVTSVAVSGSDGIEVDSGSPITTSGTIALGVNKTTMLSTLNVEDGADVTDATNVVSSLSGATITSATVATDDKVLIQDTNDSDNLKYVTAQSIADLASGGDAWSDPVDSNIIPDLDATYALGSSIKGFTTLFSDKLECPGDSDTYITLNDNPSIHNQIGIYAGGVQILEFSGVTNKRLYGNRDLNDVDFIWSGDVDDSLFFINAGTDKVGIGVNPNEKLTVEGVLSLDEVTAPSATSGYGKLYVKSSDSNLYYLNGSGTETQLGAGGISQFECTVGASGADYTTLGAAITAGKTRILVIDDTTETGDITLPSNCLIQGIGRDAVNIDMVNYSFATITGSVSIKDLKITRSGSVSASLLAASGNFFELRNIYIDNNTTTSSSIRDTILVTSIKALIDNCIFELPNLRYNKISLYNNTENGITFSNNTIIGGGTSCYDCVLLRCNVTNLFFEGVFSSTSSQYSAEFGGDYATTVTGISTDTPIQLLIEGLANITNINGDTNSVKIEIGGNMNTINNVTLPAANSDITITSGNNNLNNFFTNGSITIGSGYDRNQLSNIQTTGVVSITGNDTTLTGCRIGADAGGGSNTITVNSGANRTIISGCRTDAAIVNNGTDTTTSGNVVY